MATHRPRIMQQLASRDELRGGVAYKDGWVSGVNRSVPAVAAAPGTFEKGHWAYDALDGDVSTGFAVYYSPPS